MTDQELIRLAFEAQKHSYSPYSRFGVGAALLTKDGKVYQGANIENASFGAGVCAERDALYTAVYAGERDFAAIAIVGKPENKETFDYCSPCGICRQALREFCDPATFRVILPRSEEDYKVYTLEEIFPLGFSKKDME